MNSIGVVLSDFRHFFKFGLPKLPVLDNVTRVRGSEICMCRDLELFGLLPKDFPSDICSCRTGIDSPSLRVEFCSVSNPAYQGRTHFSFSHMWFAHYTPDMFRELVLAYYLVDVHGSENMKYSYGKCSERSCASKRDGNLFNGQCFDCSVFPLACPNFSHYLKNVQPFANKPLNFAGVEDFFVRPLLKNLLNDVFLGQDFVSGFYKQNLRTYLIDLFNRKYLRQTLRREPLLRDPYARPLGCPDGEDPLKFVVQKIVAQGKQCRLYGDYGHYNAHLESARDVLILDSDVESGRGRVLKYDYEELRRKVLVRP